MKVYLAGPDVFLPDPLARSQALKAICAAQGLEGVFPLDPLAVAEPAAWSALPAWQRISLRNEAHIRGCDLLIANLTPFRGPSADAGTVFELGFMRALGRPVFGWSNVAAPFTERTRRFLGDKAAVATDGVWHDAAGMALESFGCGDNLMIDGAIHASGGDLVAHDVAAARLWSDLAAFAQCVEHAARRLSETAA